MDEEQPIAPEVQSHDYVDIKELLPANPIYDKPVSQEKKPILRIQFIKNEIITREHLKPVFKAESEPSEPDEESIDEPESAFQSHYQSVKSVYRRQDNSEWNRVGGTIFYASTFIDRRLFKQNKEALTNLQLLQKEVMNEQPLLDETKLQKNEVRFDSSFQSGNLFSVFKKSPAQYDLILQNDINSRGNTQWFYFTVSNLPQNVEVTFNIVNLQKSDSLFNYGMQPVVMSQTKWKKNGEGWYRCGKNITYTKNTIRKEKSKRFYYTLSFRLTSKIANDTLHVAHCFPYTYKKLQDYLASLTKSTPKKGPIIQRSVIGKSVGNIPIELLTITQSEQKKTEPKKIIVVLARQHPGQTQGSYVCEGLIDFLLGKTKQAQMLRKNYVFKIIPMVNPDGVIFGNYRTNLMGYDLNRKWDVYDKDQAFPEVTCIKQLITELNKEKRVRAIIDLHGHSKKLGSFFYGNPYPQHPQLVRGFPYICSRLTQQICFQDCTFTIEEQKRKAARVYLSLTHHLINVYTFQASFYGYIKDSKKLPFGIEEFKGLGSYLCQGLCHILQYDLLVQQKAGDKIAASQYAKLLNELRENPNLIMMGDRDESGSQSKPDEFEKPDLESPPKTVPILEDLPREEDQLKGKDQVVMVVNSNPISRKGKRQIKEMIKNTRQLKVMEISRVNSILPDKYQLALEPAPAVPSIPYVPESLDRKRMTIRQSLKDLKISTYTQTMPIDDNKWEEMIPIEPYESEEKTKVTSHAQSRPASSRFRDNYDIKYISLTNSRGKKANVLKLQVLSTRPLEPIHGHSTHTLLKSYKSRHSQTILSCSPIFQNMRFKSITHFPSVDAAAERLELREEAHKVRGLQILKHSRLNNKRDNQDFLNDMIRKYLVGIKDRTKVKPIISQEERIFFEKSSPPRTEDLPERPLSIKKKEIFVQKKLQAKPRM